MSEYTELTILIDKLPEIKKLFHTEYKSLFKPQFKPPTQDPFEVIHDVPEYMKWKADIQFNLEKLPDSQIVSDINDLFRRIDNSLMGEDDTFSQLEAKLLILRKHIPIEVNGDSYEEGINKTLLNALVTIQRNPIYFDKNENELNDVVRDLLRMADYNVKDQTRQGESESGKEAGEIDILIHDNSDMPKGIIEALQLGSLDKANITKHLNKVLEKYDPNGYRYAFLLIYYKGKSLNTFWNKMNAFVDKEYRFPFDKIGEVTEIDTGYSESRHGFILLKRNGRDVHLHLYAVQMK